MGQGETEMIFVWGIQIQRNMGNLSCWELTEGYRTMKSKAGRVRSRRVGKGHISHDWSAGVTNVKYQIIKVHLCNLKTKIRGIKKNQAFVSG